MLCVPLLALLAICESQEILDAEQFSIKSDDGYDMGVDFDTSGAAITDDGTEESLFLLQMLAGEDIANPQVSDSNAQ